MVYNISQQAIKHSRIDPESIEDICVGTVLAKGPTYEARTAALTAGIPESVPVQTLNRFCSSGLMAVTTIANEIRAGQIDVGLAVGVESMSWKSVTRRLVLECSRVDIHVSVQMLVQRVQATTSRRVALQTTHYNLWAGQAKTWHMNLTYHERIWTTLLLNHFSVQRPPIKQVTLQKR
jgi:acetyl-CoA acetyltransferase